MRRLAQIAIVFGLPLNAVPTNAATLTWAIDGVITDSPQGNFLEGILPVGTPVDFVVKVDTEAPDLCPTPNAGLYAAPPASVSFGGNTYTSIETFFEVQNSFGNCLGGTGVVARFIFGGAPFSFGTLGWVGPIGELLPTEPPTDGFFWFSYAGFDPTVSGEITGSEVVPEPSTLILALTGLAALRLRRRHR